ncbi:hypothetical protein FKP32DRAFT_675904 [Trametes sanguinea]|nr:hypothetical protein FKP32DRAFT_675904 [Trametes sanguinea]
MRSAWAAHMQDLASTHVRIHAAFLSASAFTVASTFLVPSEASDGCWNSKHSCAICRGTSICCH